MFVLAAIVYATAMPAAIDPGVYRISALTLLYGNPLARLFEFTLGMAVTLAWQRGHDRMRLSLCLATALALGLLGAIVAGLYWTRAVQPPGESRLGDPGSTGES